MPEMLPDCAAAMPILMLATPIALSHRALFCVRFIAISPLSLSYLPTNHSPSSLVALSLEGSSLAWRNTVIDTPLPDPRYGTSSARPGSDSPSRHSHPHSRLPPRPSFPHSPPRLRRR